jgi:plastocyanin
MIMRMAVGDNINPHDTKSASEEEGVPNANLKADATLTMSVASVECAVGEKVELPVSIDDATGVSGFELTVSYPPDDATLRFDSAKAGSLTSGFQLRVNTGTGYTKVGMSRGNEISSPAKAPVTGSLVTLVFQVVSTAQVGQEIPIKLTSARLKGQYGDSFDWYYKVERSDGAIATTPSETGEGEGEGGEGEGEGEAPQASFEADPTTGTAPLTVSFANLSTPAGVSSAWDFGDGGTSSQANPSHTFNDPGTYTVKLTVTNTHGTDDATANITVESSETTTPPSCLGGTLTTPSSGAFRGTGGDVAVLAFAAMVLLVSSAWRRSKPAAG